MGGWNNHRGIHSEWVVGTITEGFIVNGVVGTITEGFIVNGCLEQSPRDS